MPAKEKKKEIWGVFLLFFCVLSIGNAEASLFAGGRVLQISQQTIRLVEVLQKMARADRGEVLLRWSKQMRILQPSRTMDLDPVKLNGYFELGVLSRTESVVAPNSLAAVELMKFEGRGLQYLAGQLEGPLLDHMYSGRILSSLARRIEVESLEGTILKVRGVPGWTTASTRVLREALVDPKNVVLLAQNLQRIPASELLVLDQTLTIQRTLTLELEFLLPMLGRTEWSEARVAAHQALFNIRTALVESALVKPVGNKLKLFEPAVRTKGGITSQEIQLLRNIRDALGRRQNNFRPSFSAKETMAQLRLNLRTNPMNSSSGEIFFDVDREILRLFRQVSEVVDQLY